jgi:predicted ArsR family transcriptional regulator
MHDGRLNLMCCLLNGGSLSVLQLAGRVGESPQAVRYWMDLLEAFGLVENAAELGGGEPLYRATLEGQPEWVRKAISAHRPRVL